MKRNNLTVFSLLPLCLLAPLTAASEKPWDLRVEARANYRNSEEVVFPTGLSNAIRTVPAIAAIADGFDMHTVNAGSHAELSNLTAFGKWQLSENWQAFTKVDAIDLYERNPTSSDKSIDVDQLWIRYGTRHSQGELPEAMTFYMQAGKFGKFERQDDRHLESYGLVSTAFNRLEDSGVEFGLDFSNGLYGKVSLTSGNPFFFRDPNALAGDNGVFDEPEEDIKSGMPILYDAEVEEYGLGDSPETGIGIGYRWLSADGSQRVNVLAYHYQRNMKETAELHGTEYGGELDLLAVTPAEVPDLTAIFGLTEDINLPYSGKRKEESGMNLWWYWNDLAVFGQYVYQNAAGLQRHGRELEISYAFTEIPYIQGISPVVRYSKLIPHYGLGPSAFDKVYPSPSVVWEWSKYDVGFNVDINKQWRLTAEYADNTMVRLKQDESMGETLVTLRFRHDF